MNLVHLVLAVVIVILHLFGAVTLTRKTDIEKYGYSGSGIGFDRRSSFSFPSVGFDQNVLMIRKKTY